MTAILAAGGYANNAELIVACRDLGYLDDHTPTWDGTYRHGRFWTLWQPQQLHRTDLDPAHSPDHPGGLDATTTPYPDGHWARIVLDPPYKLNGTSTGQGAASSDRSYGVDQPATWQERHTLIRAMTTEAHRVLTPGGYLLLKCQDQVCSGQVRWQTREFADHAEQLGMRLVDALHLLGHRPQPAGRRQVHARRNYSTLLVLRKNR